MKKLLTGFLSLSLLSGSMLGVNSGDECTIGIERNLIKVLVDSQYSNLVMQYPNVDPQQKNNFLEALNFWGVSQKNLIDMLPDVCALITWTLNITKEQMYTLDLDQLIFLTCLTRYPLNYFQQLRIAANQCDQLFDDTHAIKKNITAYITKKWNHYILFPTALRSALYLGAFYVGYTKPTFIRQLVQPGRNMILSTISTIKSFFLKNKLSGD